MVQFKDVRGNLVEVGDSVAFSAGGKHGGLRIGKVVREELRKSRYGTSQEHVLVINYLCRKKNVGVALALNAVSSNLVRINP